MTAEVAELAEQHAALAGVLDGLGDDGDAWSTPVGRCPGWDVADVVAHLTHTDRMAVGSLTGRFDEVVAELGRDAFARADVDAGADAMVARDRVLGRPPSEVRQRWLDGTARLRSALDDTDPRARVPWVAGMLSARTLATTRLAECWIHTGDVAEAVGVSLPPAGDRLRSIARLAWRTLPYAFERAGRTMAGPVAFHLVGPSGEDWRFDPEDEPAVTVVAGDAEQLCLVAGRRLQGVASDLRADGPDADAVLALVRTYA